MFHLYRQHVSVEIDHTLSNSTIHMQQQQSRYRPGVVQRVPES
jgi:hypothetical protein